MASYLSDLIQYRRLFQMMLVLGIGGNLLPGFHLSVINYPSMHIKRFINKTWLERYGFPLPQETITLLWSLIVSIYCVGGLLGCLCSGYLFVKYGKVFLGTESLWPLLLAVCGIAAFVQLVSLPFFPESPPYLLMQKEDTEGCLKAMKELWGEGDHQADFDDMMKEKAAMKSIKTMSVLEVMKEPALRWQLYIMILLMMSIQLCGLSAIYFYTFEVFRAARLDEDLIPYIALGVGICEFFSNILCSFIIDRFGRRMLLWGGYGLMAGMMAFLVTALSLQNQFSWMASCSVILIFLFIIAYGIGPSGAVTSVMMEIFNQSARSSAFVIAGTIGWMGLMVIGMIFPFTVEALGPFSFLIFVGVLVISGIFSYLLLPETKGKSIMEITEMFSTIYFGKKLLLIAGKNSPVEHTFCTKF
ncbi:solute carrier family 2, facilitated glucose transporter member 11-like isoform X4 [Dermochelys coriacea]|uniref:solute carrier family 2, facilitated glucose transporter member 11-like isoform X4 n=1 Tax=Dermochelys coriacea TaxID=27794 RepID=UPI001CAA1FE7|nr:solute carrier family 2, facilitated glucose transporter member 11-like isoform X4 [Dermochelys coriacea]